ncbi:MAG: diguanylate cyclase [Rhodocyclaceae bacterium]|nr:diguanylate cyclase [Rhodocyclaceae bacterium]
MSGLPRILIVDDSRIVRISLANQLKGHYDIREESDGEGAWQALVLDHDLQAVISDLQMPKLDGFGLLERVRSSKLRRLQQLPFILVSGEETEEERGRAKALGVSDFITKGIGSNEILTRLDHLLALSNARESLDTSREHMVRDTETGLFSRKYLELQAAQALSHAARHHGQVSVLVLSLDRYDAICAQLGAPMAEQVGNRLAKMLAAKIRQEDSLGHYEPGRYAIVSPGTAPATCVIFAERVRQAVEAAHIAAHGQRVALTVSVGVASVPEARVSSAGALLELAGSRMREAMQAGGNRIVSGGPGQGEAPTRPMSIQQAIDLLRTGRPEPVLSLLPALGLQVLPLLQLLDKELGLALPLAEIEQQLITRAREQEARKSV